MTDFFVFVVCVSLRLQLGNHRQNQPAAIPPCIDLPAGVGRHDAQYPRRSRRGQLPRLCLASQHQPRLVHAAVIAAVQHRQCAAFRQHDRVFLADSRTLRGSALTGGAAKNNNSSPRLDVDGTFTWADGAIKPAVGYQSYTVLFTPNDKDNYNTAECEVSLTVKCSHIWDDGTVTTPPACTAEGVETFTCAACSATKEESIPATETTEGEPLDHDYADEWQANETDHWHTCTRCMAAEGQALGHDWSDWAVTTPATERTGGEETRVCGHDASHTETRIIPKITPAPQPSRDDPAGGTTDTGNAADDTGRTVRSSDTGIAFYVLLSLTSLTGTAVICRKWKKNG